MPAFAASAPGKIILFGEHAVVYGQPAIAVPVHQVQARVVVNAQPLGEAGKVRLVAPEVGLDAWLDELAPEHPLALVIEGILGETGLSRLPACSIRIESSIPVAAGLGSGAAVSVALIRAVTAFLGHSLEAERVSALAYEVEKLYHGTPSGIDNTVVTFAQPVYFIKGQPVETFQVSRAFTIVIGDTGIPSPTARAVGDLRRAWQADPHQYETIFTMVGRLVGSARLAIESGRIQELGALMDENHGYLQAMGVSCPELDRLVQAARQHGAYGAKLSGGGRGGNMIALAPAARAERLAAALQSAGAVRTIVTQIRQVNGDL